MALIGSGHLNVGLHITDGLTRSIKDKSVFELRVVKGGVEAAFFVDGDLRSALGGGKSGGGRNPGGNAADDNNFHCLSLTIPPGGSPSLRQNLQGVTYSGWEDCPRCPR